MTRKKIFVDSDVVLSSILSVNGAAYFLLNKTKLELFISNVSVIELERGVVKLNLDKQKLTNLVKNRVKVVRLKESIREIKEVFQEYVFDENDAHIVAGAVEAKTKLILSYNLRHYNHSKLKQDLSIIVKTPAEFLQYLRSR